jgi:hypothetical protein
MGQAAFKLPEPEFDPEAAQSEPHALMDDCCADELSHAVAHEWLELETLVPWTDTLPPDRSRPFPVTRSFRWSGEEGGDMVCEVSVHELPDRSGHVVRRSCVIQRG